MTGLAHLTGWAARSELAYAVATGDAEALYDVPRDVAADVRAVLDVPAPTPTVGDGRRLTGLSFGVGLRAGPEGEPVW